MPSAPTGYMSELEPPPGSIGEIIEPVGMATSAPPRMVASSFLSRANAIACRQALRSSGSAVGTSAK
ncbi:unannotated protein [freshwater metagenome]|uniref:Unannotated protein n=1 Tax=freshwater metagenome TaxID=449393 RepID=A0A6J5ZLV4_9ZZZZ